MRVCNQEYSDEFVTGPGELFMQDIFGSIFRVQPFILCLLHMQRLEGLSLVSFVLRLIQGCEIYQKD